MTPISDTDPDLTRKQQREQARAERKALEAAAAQAARRTRMIQLAGVIGAVVVIVVVIVLATGGKKGTASSASNSSSVAAVSALVGGIPQSGNVLGNPKAPVTMQYFGDLECPICREFTLGALPALVAKYVRTGKLKIEYHSMETATREPETFNTQQIAALAAGKQNLGWYYIELFYHEQGEEDSGYVTESYLQSLAQQVPGLNLAAWSAARNDPALAEQIKHDAQTVTQQGFTGTPSFLLGKSGGPQQQLKPETYTEASPYEAAIGKLLS
jgi:protein-disulfide isomerase